MANKDSPTGGALGALNPANYYSVEKRNINFRALAEMFIGGLLLVIGTGWATLIGALAEGFTILLDGVTGYLGLLQDTLQQGIFQLGWVMRFVTLPFQWAGPFALPMTLAVGLVALWIIRRGFQ